MNPNNRKFKDAFIKSILDHFEDIPWRLLDEGVTRWEFSQLNPATVQVTIWQKDKHYPDYYSIKITQHV